VLYPELSVLDILKTKHDNIIEGSVGVRAVQTTAYTFRSRFDFLLTWRHHVVTRVGAGRLMHRGSMSSRGTILFLFQGDLIGPCSHPAYCSVGTKCYMLQ